MRLVILDSEVDSQILINTLHQIEPSIEQEVCQSLEQAEALMETGEFDAVVSDLHVPGSDVEDVTEFLGEVGPCAVITGDEDAQRARELAQKNIPVIPKSAPAGLFAQLCAAAVGRLEGSIACASQVDAIMS